MDCTHTALVTASFLVSIISEFAFAAVGFGPAIIYQISWQLLALVGISGGSLTEAVGNLVIIEVPTGILQLWLQRRNFLWRLALIFCAPYAVTLPLGTLVLERFGKSTWMKRLLGAVLLVVALGQILQRVRARGRGAAASSRPSLEVEPRSWSTVGFIALASACSGFLRGLFGVAGPPMMILLMFFPIDPGKYRSTGAIFRMVTPVVQGALLFADKDIRPQCWRMYCSLMVGGLLGVALGNLVASHIDRELFQRSILLFLTSGALLMLCSGMEVASAISAALVLLAFLVVLLLPIASAVRRKRSARAAALRAGLADGCCEEMRATSAAQDCCEETPAANADDGGAR